MFHSIDELIKKGKANIRKPNTFSFGDYQTCEDLFKEAFIKTDQTIPEGKFQMLPEYKEVVNWMVDTQGKGLLLGGDNGRGKSAILGGVIPLIFLAKFNKIVNTMPATELHKVKAKWCISIDDVGTEPIVNDYGTKIDAVQLAVSHAEDRIKLLFISSNLDKNDLINRYGIRVWDRIRRLCKPVIFRGESLR